MRLFNSYLFRVLSGLVIALVSVTSISFAADYCGGTSSTCSTALSTCNNEADGRYNTCLYNAKHAYEPGPCAITWCSTYLIRPFTCSNAPFQSCTINDDCGTGLCSIKFANSADATGLNNGYKCTEGMSPFSQDCPNCEANLQPAKDLCSSNRTVEKADCTAKQTRCLNPCYTIYSYKTGTGTGTISPAGYVTAAERYTPFTITADSCSSTDVVLDGQHLGPVQQYSVEDNQSNRTIQAIFNIKQYTISASAGTGGTISLSSPNPTNCGSSRTITITANSGYHIVSVLVDGASLPSSYVYGKSSYPYPFSNITANHSISATFSDKYSLTYSASTGNSGNGTVTSHTAGINACGATCTGQFLQDSIVSLTAIPDSDSTFAGWSGACSGTGACAVTMNGDKQLSATFNIKTPVAVFTASSTAGSLPLRVNFTNLSQYSDTYTWNFGDGKTSNLKDAQHIFTTAGTRVVTLTVKNLSGTHMSSMTITVSPCSNFPVRVIHPDNSVSGYYSTLQSAYNAAIAGDTIQALDLNLIDHLIADGSKTVSLRGGYSCSYAVQEGITSLQGMVTVSNGINTIGGFDLVTGPTGNPEYILTADATLGGNISSRGTVPLAQGSNYTFTMTPDSGSSLLDVLIDGASVGAVSPYTFANVSASHTIKAIFSRKLTVTKSGVGTGTVTSTPAGITCGASCIAQYQSGSTVTLTATPAANSQFTGWSGGGCSGAAPCTVTMDSDKTVTAIFFASRARVVGATPLDFDTIQAAYNAAPDGATIIVRDLTLTENFDASAPKTIIIEGGFDAGYFTAAGVTTLKGSLTTTSGITTIKNVLLEK